MQPSPQTVTADVERALAEDVGSGDISAALIPVDTMAQAHIVSRERGVVCGCAWVDEVFRQLGGSVYVEWQTRDGERIGVGDELALLSGPARPLLTGERSALNFLQLLSGIASRSFHYAQLVAGAGVKLLDTRKTLPGLRVAQKYAVAVGGCHNHRQGLYDAFLIKENHIRACGDIAEAVQRARASSPGIPVEVEVESLNQLEEALDAAAERIMLDNFSLAELRTAVAVCGDRAELEASGGITESSLREVADTGVDYISLGTLTKDTQALDLSMLLL